MTTLRLCILCCALLAVSNVQAQSHFRLVFKGTSVQTNSAGKVFTRAISQQTWLKDFVRDQNLTSTKNLAVSYHVNADEKGDQIEVVHVKTGQVYGSILGLFFSEAFGRTGLTNAIGTQTKTLQYLYTSQDSHSLGAAVITKALPVDMGRSPKINGQMQYQLLPNANRRSVQICSGSFVTGKPFAFQNATQ